MGARVLPRWQHAPLLDTGPKLARCPRPGLIFRGAARGDYPSAVGRHWIEWFRLVHGGPCCNYVSFYYQNIATGTVRTDPTTNTTVPDLGRAVAPPHDLLAIASAGVV